MPAFFLSSLSAFGDGFRFSPKVRTLCATHRELPVEGEVMSRYSFAFGGFLAVLIAAALAIMAGPRHSTFAAAEIDAACLDNPLAVPGSGDAGAWYPPLQQQAASTR
jgi:hypothetical protein